MARLEIRIDAAVYNLMGHLPDGATVFPERATGSLRAPGKKDLSVTIPVWMSSDAKLVRENGDRASTAVAAFATFKCYEVNFNMDRGKIAQPSVSEEDEAICTP